MHGSERAVLVQGGCCALALALLGASGLRALVVMEAQLREAAVELWGAVAVSSDEEGQRRCCRLTKGARLLVVRWEVEDGGWMSRLLLFLGLVEGQDA